MKDGVVRVLNLYAGIGGNRKLLRNAVYPPMGLHVFNAATKQIKQEQLL